MKRLLLGIAATAILLPSASADELVLRNGSTFNGAVREEGDRVIVEMDYGTMSFKKVDVKSISRGEDLVRTFEERAARAEGSQELVEVALWGREKGLGRRSDELLNRILKLDPDQAEARRALGYEKVNGLWLKGDELRAARGQLKVENRWLPLEEARRQLDRQEESRREVERNALETRIADQKHTEELQRLALERERLEIARRESEVRMAEVVRRSWNGNAPYPFDDPVVYVPPPPADPRPPQPAPPGRDPSTRPPSAPTSLPLTPPTVLPLSPPWQRPVLHSSQPPSHYEEKEKKEDEPKKR